MINIKKILAPRKSGGGTTIVNGGGKQSTSITSQYVSSAQIDTLLGNDLNYQKGTFVDLTASNGIIANLSGTNLEYENGTIDNLESDVINAGDITADSITATKGSIDSLESKNIVTEYLTVTKQAHFFELIIDKIRSVGGSVILSATNCVLDYAEPIYDSNDNIIAYDVYWQATDNKGKAIVNKWLQNDQAICQNFNDAREGTSQYVSNKYYWRLVKWINSDTYMWLGSENDPRNGMTVQASESSINKINLDIWNWIGGQPVANGKWTVTPQSGAGWSTESGAANYETKGTFISTNTTNGIVLTPNSYIADKILDHISIAVTTLPISTDAQIGARLNVTIMLQDGTSLYYPAGSNIASEYHFYPSNYTNTPIESIIITNADEVMYKKVHSIRLGNVTTNDPHTTEVDGTSIPGPGDNLVQLGYRYHLANNMNQERASAIIIAAYATPDSGITPPSYAQYMLINTFDLASKRHTFFDATQAHFEGDFYVDANNTIQMNVYDTINNRTGINIEQGTITLDAQNTYINGNLTLTSNDQGFTVKGPNGMTVMTPESLGTYASFITANNINDARDVTAYSITTTSDGSYNTSFTYDYCIGYINANSDITITYQSLAYKYGRIDGSLATVTTSYGNSVTYQAYLDDGTGHISSTTASTSIIGNGTSVANVGTLHITTPGKIWIRARWSPKFAISSFTNYDGLGIRTNLKYTATYPVNGVYTKIASDGIGINMNGSKYIYMGNDGVYIDYGSKGGLHINPNKIEKRDPNGTTDINGNPLWVTMSTLTTKSIGGKMTSYNINDSDEAIFINDSENASGYTCTITLPIPIDRNISSTGGWAGRIIYIKNYSNATVKVACNSGSYGYIRASGDGTPMPDQSIGKNSRFYICDGMNWLEYNANG